MILMVIVARKNRIVDAEKGGVPPRFRVLNGGKKVEDIDHRIMRRVGLIRDKVRLGDDGKKVIGIKELSELIGVSESTIEKKRFKDSEGYKHRFIDETTFDIKCSRRGNNHIREFSLEDATRLVRAIFEKEDGLIILNEMALELRVSPGTIKLWFRKNKGKLEIEIDGEKQEISLKRGRPTTGNAKQARYMDKKEYVLFKQWVEKTYEKRIWQGERKRGENIPEGYVSTGEAGKIVGRDSNYILAKIDSRKIRARQIRDGAWIITKREILRFKKRQDAHAPPEGCIRTKEMLAMTGVTESAYRVNLIKKRGKPYFRFEDNEGNSKKYRIYYDINERSWIRRVDAEEIKTVMDRRGGSIRKEETATALGITILELETRLNTKKRVLRFHLPDGTLMTAPYATVGRISLFRRAEIERIAEADKGFRENIVYVDEIAKTLGLDKTQSVITYFFKLGGTVSFTLNGKKYEIALRKEKILGKNRINARVYLTKEELEALVKWKNMKNQVTHQKLRGSKLCRNEEKFSRIRVEDNRVILYENEYGITISAPLEEANGEAYVRNEYAGLVRCYMELHSLDLKVRTRVAMAIMSENAEPRSNKGMDQLTVKLNILREAMQNEPDETLKQSLEAQLTQKNKDTRKKIIRRINDRKLVDYGKHGEKFELVTGERATEPVEMAYVIMSHPGLYRILWDMINLEVVLSEDYGIVLPIQGSNGDRAITRGDLPLLDLSIRLFSDSEDGLKDRIGLVHRFLDLFDQNDSTSIAALWVVRDFVININRSVIRKSEAVRKMYERLKLGQFMKVFEEGYFAVDRRYRLIKEIEADDDRYSNGTGCLVEGIM